MRDYYDEFREYLIGQRNLSRGTCDAYLADVGKFYSFCTSIGIKSLDRIKPEHILNYTKYLKDGGVSDSTVNRSLSSVKSYIRFLHSKGALKSDISKDVKPLSLKENAPEILEREEVIRLIEAPSGNSVKAKRDRVILELLYATGMKVSELIEILTQNVNLRFNLIKISSEKHERTVPIYPEAAKHLSEYIKVYRPAIAESGTELLFTNLSGKPLSRQGVWKLIKQYAEKAGINKNITPHTLRHSFAVHLLENGADITDIKEMMGHLDISSTMFYSSMLKNKFSKGYAKFHPLSK